MLKDINSGKLASDSFADGQKGRKQFEAGTITLEPGGAKSLPLGVYYSAEPTPTFDLSFKPDMEGMIGAALGRIDMAGTARYMLHYQFHNYGDRPCGITVRLRTGEATDTKN